MNTTKENKSGFLFLDVGTGGFVCHEVNVKWRKKL